jgi:hypothetical protein
MPPDLLEARTLTFARAAAGRGQRDQADAALVALDTAAGDALRATLSETAKDWKEATAALRSLAARSISPQAAVTEENARLLLRLASAAAQAGDSEELARLRIREAPRMPDGPTAEMFRLIIAAPVEAVADLPRAAQEARLARNVPETLKSLSPAPNRRPATP